MGCTEVHNIQNKVCKMENNDASETAGLQTNKSPFNAEFSQGAPTVLASGSAHLYIFSSLVKINFNSFRKRLVE